MAEGNNEAVLHDCVTALDVVDGAVQGLPVPRLGWALSRVKHYPRSWRAVPEAGYRAAVVGVRLDHAALLSAVMISRVIGGGTALPSM